MRERLRKKLAAASPKARAALVTCLTLLATVVLERILKQVVPEGKEGQYLVGVLQWVRDMLSWVRMDWLAIAALTAFLLYAWEERLRWLGSLGRGWKKLVSPWNPQDPIVTVNRSATVPVSPGPLMRGTLDEILQHHKSGVSGERRPPVLGGPATPFTGVVEPSLASLPRPLTPSQKDRKLGALDKLRSQVRKMQPLINRAERLKSGAWNAYAEGKGFEYSSDLLDFADQFNDETRKLTSCEINTQNMRTRPRQPGCLIERSGFER